MQITKFGLACSSSRQRSNEVENEIKEKLKFAIITTASGDGYTLNLREKDFFDFQGKGPAESKSNLYGGSWERKGDSLFLAFQMNHHPEDLTGTGKFDRANNLIILFSKDITRHRRLVIQGNTN
jgi:hypothetical protein